MTRAIVSHPLQTACTALPAALSSEAMALDNAPPFSPNDTLLETLPLSPALKALARRAVLRRYRKGVVLIQEGESGDTLYILVSGRVKVYSIGTNDREITFGLYGPGELIGEMSLDGGPRSASVITVEPTMAAVVNRQMLVEPFLQQYLTKTGFGIFGEDTITSFPSILASAFKNFPSCPASSNSVSNPPFFTSPLSTKSN